MSQKTGKKAFQGIDTKRLPTENVHRSKKLIERDENLLKELKRIKKLQKGLYKEYELEEFQEDED